VSDDADDKKHDPSERALREAGERGELPRSAELSGTVGLLAASATLLWAFPDVAEPVRAFAVRTLSLGDLDVSSVRDLLTSALTTVAWSAGATLGAAALGGTLTGLAQTRFQIAPNAFEANLERLDPLGTLQKVFFSKEPFVAMGRGVLQVLLLGGAVGVAAWSMVDDLARSTTLSVDAQLLLLGELGWRMLSAGLPAMLALAAIDYAWSYWKWWQGLMRTDQQARDDHKESEGDPQMRAQRKRRMRELSRRGGVAAVKEATVLVTNPTHYAIAIRYRHGVDAAPVVLAKGVDHLAATMRNEARTHGVPRVEDRKLARALYAQVPVGRPVPGDLYGAVARVLAIVYRRQRRTLTRSSEPAPPKTAARTAPRRSVASPSEGGS
jgi:flagellar biosynthetic protein FlhB